MKPEVLFLFFLYINLFKGELHPDQLKHVLCAISKLKHFMKNIWVSSGKLSEKLKKKKKKKNTNI